METKEISYIPLDNEDHRYDPEDDKINTPDEGKKKEEESTKENELAMPNDAHPLKKKKCR